jgi:hypothetical protein
MAVRTKFDFRADSWLRRELVDPHRPGLRNYVT